MKIIQSKKCLRCENVFNRFSGIYSNIQWENRKFCSKRCGRLGSKMPVCSRLKISNSRNGKYTRDKHPNWKGGKMCFNGYVKILINGLYIFEHRYVIENSIGRKLLNCERVHHINGIKNDNRLENLILFHNESLHQKHHHIIKKTTSVF